jgi:hypothetical protein
MKKFPKFLSAKRPFKRLLFFTVSPYSYWFTQGPGSILSPLVCIPLSFKLGLLICPEDGGSMFP